MGNELFCHYSIEKNSFLSGGHLNLWKIYRATHKERKQQTCLFVFEKKNLEQFPQGEREELLALLRKEATSLTQFKHPKILSIVEPLVEDKYSLGFITEAFSFTLNTWLSKTKPSKLEIKLIIRELCKSLSFLHNKCHIIHGNLNPDSIFVDKDNRVKLSGMNFSMSDPTPSGESLHLNSFSGNLNQNLSYAAPELILQSKAMYSSDIYSIGLLLFKCLNEKDFIKLNNNTADAYRKTLPHKIENQISKMSLEKDDIEIIHDTLIQEESKRPTVKGLLQYGWLTDYKLKALSFIEDLATNDIAQNYEFLKCLPSSLRLFDNKIITTRFLPSLLNGLKVESLINPILPAVFAICDIENIDINFEKAIWPKLKEIFQLKTIPAASLYLLLTKITFIGENIPNTEFSTHCFSLICKSMDCGVSKIQSVISDKLSFVSNHIDSQVLVNEVYPRIVQILYNTKSTSLKEKLLASLCDLVSLLDNTTINEKMLADLERIRKIDSSYQMIKGMVLIYENISKIVFIDNISTKIIPNLVSMMSNGLISKKLFDKINEVTQIYFNRIKTVREKDFCKDEEFTTNEKKENKDKVFNDQGLKLMNFFRENECEVVHLSPSNNSTTFNSTSSELIGDGFHEDNISNMNNKTDFIESLMTPKTKANKDIEKISPLVNDFKTPNNSSNICKVKTTQVKEEEKNIFDSLLNEEMSSNQNETLDFFMSQNNSKAEQATTINLPSSPKASFSQINKAKTIEIVAKSEIIQEQAKTTVPKKKSENKWDDDDEEDINFNTIIPSSQQPVHTPKEERPKEAIVHPIKEIKAIVHPIKEIQASVSTTTPITKKKASNSIKVSDSEKTNGFNLESLLEG